MLHYCRFNVFPGFTMISFTLNANKYKKKSKECCYAIHAYIQVCSHMFIDIRTLNIINRYMYVFVTISTYIRTIQMATVHKMMIE